MNKTLFLSIIFLATLSLILIQCSKSPYVGQELREIKSLSSEEIEEYLEGQGMGLAKAAELNNYPGPIHVLELAGKLQLSKDQIAITEVVYDEMHKEAVRLGKLIVKKERELDTLFIQQSIDEIQLSTIISEISKLQGELRFIHLRAHLRLKEVLLTEQLEKYNKLRGYIASGSKRFRKHQHHEHE